MRTLLRVNLAVVALALLPCASSLCAQASLQRIAMSAASSWGRTACSARRTNTILANVPSAASLELKSEIMELLTETSNRGVGAPAELSADILEVISELEAEGAADEWSNSPDLPGRWLLAYTSSKTFGNNQGLSGYARDIDGVETPELLMSIEKQFRRMVYEEPLSLRQGSLAAMVGRFAGAKAVKIECTWAATGGALAVSSQRVVVGEQSWEPADRQDKAVRVLSGGRPVFLDRDLLVLRSQPDYVVWVFRRT